MTFGYYSNPGGSSQDNLYTLSKNLLGKLANERVCAVGQLRSAMRAKFTNLQNSLIGLSYSLSIAWVVF